MAVSSLFLPPHFSLHYVHSQPYYISIPSVPYIAIDLVIGSPPCGDFSKVNANRKGLNGASGNLHFRLAKMIQEITEHAKTNHKHCYFVVENVKCTGHDKEALEQAYGVSSLDINAADYSPQFRERSFHTNLPIFEPEYYQDDIGRISSARFCLDDGFMLPIETWEDPNCTSLKTPTFMASKGKINSNQMVVVNLSDPSTPTQRIITAKERSRIMGYQGDYVVEPLALLFHQLEKPLKGGRLWHYDWAKELSPALHYFSGGWEPQPKMRLYNFDKHGRLELGPPIFGAKPDTFNYEDYARHLVGNAYSVPVMATLLKPLQKVFECSDDHYYEGVQYKYPWENMLE
jgi:site-specific DNA-cytosine methylase